MKFTPKAFPCIERKNRNKLINLFNLTFQNENPEI